MNKKNKIFTVVLVVLIIGIAGFMIWQSTKNSQGSSVLDDFAKCLTQKGLVVYGTDSCEWCQKQKADFGNSWQFITYANCGNDPQRCVAAKVEATPTWIFPDGKMLVGYQTLKQLSGASACVLPETKQ